jgi:Phage integrase family
MRAQGVSAETLLPRSGLLDSHRDYETCSYWNPFLRLALYTGLATAAAVMQVVEMPENLDTSDVLVSWQKEQGGKSPFLFPSPVKLDKPISTVRKAWKTTLTNAKVAHFPIYHLRHVFCTRLSWVAPDAVVQRAMRHSSPETKRHYQLGMVEQVRQNLEKANENVYGGGQSITFL